MFGEIMNKRWKEWNEIIRSGSRVKWWIKWNILLFVLLILTYGYVYMCILVMSFLKHSECFPFFISGVLSYFIQDGKILKVILPFLLLWMCCSIQSYFALKTHSIIALLAGLFPLLLNNFAGLMLYAGNSSMQIFLRTILERELSFFEQCIIMFVFCAVILFCFLLGKREIRKINLL